MMKVYRHIVLVLALGSQAATANAQPEGIQCGSDRVRTQLEEMQRTDISFRDGTGADLDSLNLTNLVKIVEACGWPLISSYGKEAALGAFLVLQHAPLDAQLKYVDLLREANTKNELRKGSLPLLEDRILVRQGKPQIYGSQMMAGGVPYPIFDEANLDRRRKEVGLGPYSEYLKDFQF